jgi:aromatic ring-opening dioxygenase catalytic subunit (LigB family)
MSTGPEQPSIYIPHGGGPAFFITGGMHELFVGMQGFLADLHKYLPGRPSAILVVSAHWEAEVATFSSGQHPELIYDYYGFPPETYSLKYAAPAAAALAVRAADLLRAAGIATRLDPAHGWDHGVFIPLKVMFPQADIPVLAMSLAADLDPLAHVAMGHALGALRREGVLIVGSGLSYHNLRNFANGGAAAAQFDGWLDRALDGDAAHRRRELERWAQAPSARAAHPREEHLLPLMVASGAGGDKPATRIWRGIVGDTAVGAWAFH